MSRRLQLKPSERRPVTSAFIVLAGGIVGAILGWMLFLSPNTEPESGALTSGETAVAGQNQRTLAVQSTGTPVARLSGAVRVGEVPPDFQLRDLEGEVHTLGQHRGEAVILNFWTTWCPPCRLEMPALQQVYDRYSDAGLVILGINLTESDEPELVGPYREELGLTFPILMDAESEVSGDLYRVLGLPTSVFIDREGIVREVYIGAIPLEDLESKVRLIMGNGA